MRVVILHDRMPLKAGPDEVDTLVQAEEVAWALRSLGHFPCLLEFDPSDGRLAEQLSAHSAELVFNLVETPRGQGPSVGQTPALLERLGLPFTGSGQVALEATSNKLTAKKILVGAKLDTPLWLGPVIGEAWGVEPGRVYILKSVWEHGSLGLDEDSLIRPHSLAQLLAELAQRREAYGGEWFAEAFISGREFNLALLAGPNGPHVLPPAEILFDQLGAQRPHLVGYKAKWEAESYEYNHTPRRFDFSPQDQALIQDLSGLAEECWRLFGLRGYARVDFRVDEASRPWILEINANPCLTNEAGFMAAARQLGLSQADVVNIILTEALTQAGEEGLLASRRQI